MSVILHMPMKAVQRSILIACAIFIAQEAHSADPLIRIERPGSTSPQLTVQASKRFRNSTTIPYSHARIVLAGPDHFSQTLKADVMGRLLVDPVLLLKRLKKAPDRITVTATTQLGKSHAEASITLTREEIKGYLRTAAEILNKEGTDLARSGQYGEALEKYLLAKELAPSFAKVFLNSAMIYERFDAPNMAISLYKDYLLTDLKDLAERRKVKHQVV